MNSQSIDLVNPSKKVGTKSWNIVNDDVMGGISTSYLSLSNDKNLVFNGFLSLENNGGFASSRLSLKNKILKGIKSFKIKIRGDGKSYKLRLRQNNMRASYSCDFKSLKDKWVELNIPINDFKATWRGYYYSDFPDIDSEKINSIGLQISDKQEGDFKLEIEYIKAIF